MTKEIADTERSGKMAKFRHFAGRPIKIFVLNVIWEDIIISKKRAFFCREKMLNIYAAVAGDQKLYLNSKCFG